MRHRVRRRRVRVGRAGRSSTWPSRGSRACATAAPSRPTACRATAPACSCPSRAQFFARRRPQTSAAAVEPDRLGVAFAFLDLTDDAACRDARSKRWPTRARSRASSSLGWRDVPDRRVTARRGGSRRSACACARHSSRGPPTSTTPKPSGARCGPAAAPEAACRGVRSAALLRELVVLDGHVQGARHQRSPGSVLSRPRATDVRGAVRDLPQPVLHEHLAGVGARATVPPPRATTARSTRSRATRTGCSRAGCSAPKRSGSARRSCSAPSSIRTTPTPASSTRRSSCCVRGGRDVRHVDLDARSRSVGRRARPRPRCARLLPVPRVRSPSRGTARRA